MHFFDTDSKIACISDIHLGVHQNSATWHEIAIQFAHWLRDTLRDRHITNIVIPGDVFHNRHEIGVNTLHAAYKFFNILKEFNIAISTGNHDCYYKDKSDVNSITVLENERLAVYQNLRTFKFKDKMFTFCPWGVAVDSIPKSDVVFGHFEITNFRMNAHKICDHGISTESLLDKAKLIISGHFHYRELRQYSNNRSVLYLGSPYELDFGDRDQDKGLTILDPDTLELEFVPNNVTPKHIKVNFSDITKYTPTQLTSVLNNNIISLNIDVKADMQTVSLLQQKLSEHKPLQFRTEYNFTDTTSLSAEDMDKLSIDVETAMQEFIELLNVDVDKKLILEKCLELYKISQTSHE